MEYEVAIVPCTWSNQTSTITYGVKVRSCKTKSFLWWEWNAYSKWLTVVDANNTINWWSLEEATKRAEWIERNGIIPSSYSNGIVHAISDRFNCNAVD